jgi:hypothetical protein
MVVMVSIWRRFYCPWHSSSYLIFRWHIINVYIPILQLISFASISDISISILLQWFLRWYSLNFAHKNYGPSQRPRGLRHKMLSPAQALGSLVRIPLEAWISLCLSSVFVLSCVGSGLETDWSPDQGVLPVVYKIHNVRSNSELEQATQSNSSR